MAATLEWKDEFCQHPIFQPSHGSLMDQASFLLSRDKELLIVMDREIRALNIQTYQEEYENKAVDLSTLSKYTVSRIAQQWQCWHHDVMCLVRNWSMKMNKTWATSCKLHSIQNSPCLHWQQREDCLCSNCQQWFHPIGLLFDARKLGFTFLKFMSLRNESACMHDMTDMFAIVAIWFMRACLDQSRNLSYHILAGIHIAWMIRIYSSWPGMAWSGKQPCCKIDECLTCPIWRRDRMYHVLKNVNHPELVISLLKGKPSKEMDKVSISPSFAYYPNPPVSFVIPKHSFHAQVDPWTLFSIYIVFQDGQLFKICPFLPRAW